MFFQSLLVSKKKLYRFWGSLLTGHFCVVLT